MSIYITVLEMGFFFLAPMTVSVSLMELIHLHIYMNKFSSSFINECMSAFVCIWGRTIIERKQNENGTCYFFSLLLTCKLDAPEGYKNSENHIKPNTIHDKWRRRQANEQSKVGGNLRIFTMCAYCSPRRSPTFQELMLHAYRMRGEQQCHLTYRIRCNK